MSGRVTRPIRCGRYLLELGAIGPPISTGSSDTPRPPDIIGLNYYVTSDRYPRRSPRSVSRWRRLAGTVANATPTSMRRSVAGVGIRGHARC